MGVLEQGTPEARRRTPESTYTSGPTGGVPAARRDDWDIERWRLDAKYRGWSAATLGFELRRQTRDGFIDRPYYALNVLYPLRVELDETLIEAGFSLETRNLPATVYFEQSFARFEDENRWLVTDPRALGGDPDLLAEATPAREGETLLRARRPLVGAARGGMRRAREVS